MQGRISSVGGTYAYSTASNSYNHNISAYNLDELQAAWGIYFQDSYRVRPNLTINYGLRWDFTGDNHDLTGAYHSSSEASIYGPSGVGNLFNPGTFRGADNPTVDAHSHVYAPWNVSPQPALVCLEPQRW
jgi:outer membrane receptor protein involved in Fe transport